MTMTLPAVLDASVALIAEGYMSLGADWWTALEEAGKVGMKEVPETLSGEAPRREKTEEEKVAENNAVLASLMGGLKQSDFGGAKA